ncbi:MAG: hypothetical protein KAY38_04410 [Acinetobacter sp.]|nr:hypothetical protein [Acinetobacter sp.]
MQQSQKKLNLQITWQKASCFNSVFDLTSMNVEHTFDFERCIYSLAGDGAKKLVKD